MFALLAASSGLAARLAPAPASDAGPAEMLAKVYLVCLANTAVLVYALRRSCWLGAKLAATLFLLHFGIGAFMSQNETLYFNAALTVPLPIVWAYLASSLFTAALFAPFAVWLFGRTRPVADGGGELGVTRSGLAWRTALVACLVYPALYFSFGYFVLWQIPEARLLYQGSSAIVPFPEHMAGVLRDDPWLLPWQCLRGLLWVGLALPVMRMARAGWIEVGVLVGLLFAVLMNAQLLIPNPYMPPAVQLGHMLETAVSNFLLGLCTVFVLRPGPELPFAIHGRAAT